MDAYSGINNFEYGKLYERYNLKSRQTLLDRVNALRSKGLDIRPTKQGNQKFIKGYELRWLDDLHEHLKQDGATLANFDPNPERPLATVDTVLIPGKHQNQLQETHSEAMSTNVQYFSPDILELAHAVAHLLQPDDRFSNYEQLERFARNGWLMRSRDLRELIEQRRIPEEWGGFRLENVKQGWWRVTSPGGLSSK